MISDAPLLFCSSLQHKSITHRISVPDPFELLTSLEHLAHTLPWFVGMMKGASLSTKN
jgi:hypothetical protein